jgi:exopolysaccharide biosynthesis polyprenyl glycosylphosphotransferase
MDPLMSISDNRQRLDDALKRIDDMPVNPPPGAEGKRRAHSRDVLTRRALVVSDLLCTALVLWLVISVIGTKTEIHPLVLIYLAVVPITSKMLGLYDNDDTRLRHVTLDEMPRILVLASIVVGIAWLADGAILDGEVGHNQRLGLLIGVALLVTLSRGLTRRAVVRALPAERCLVIGDKAKADELTVRFERSHSFKAEIVSQIEFPHNPEDALSAAFEVEELTDNLLVERVIVAPSRTEDMAVARAINSAGIKVSVVPMVKDVAGTSLALDDLVGLTMLGMQRPRLTGSSALTKRFFDLTVGLILTLLFLPIMALIALAVRIESPGPALYRQRRVGKDEFQFTMIKFRTMSEGSHSKRTHLATLNESDGLFKITDDPRLTRVGRVLRKSSLDELPQLFNVIGGSMSLVGPRPLVPEEDMLLSGWARFRYSVLPGMTGPWQLGSAARFSITDMASLDYLYVTNWSLWNDIKMLIRTAIYVLGLHGR